MKLNLRNKKKTSSGANPAQFDDCIQETILQNKIKKVFFFRNF